MSDELPPPPVSKTRASQIAINFAGRVKHQIKDERKQWTALDKELASEAVRKVEKLMRRCSCCSYCLPPHPLTSRASRSLPYYALLLTACCDWPLITRHLHSVVRSEDKKLAKDKEKGDADRILRR